MDDDGFDPQVLENEIGDFWSSESIDKKSSESRKESEKFYIPRQPILAKDNMNWDELYSSIVYDVWARFMGMQSLDVRNGLGLDPLNWRIEVLSRRFEDISSLEALPEDKISEISSDMQDKSIEFIEGTSEDLDDVGLWVPSEFDYRTDSGGFIDSIWWSFKKLMDKELLAKKEKPVKWCPNCRISPSLSEISTKHETREKIFVKIPLASGKRRYFLLEIEDLWMFPASLTIAATSSFKYAVVKIDSEDGNQEQLVMLEKNVDSIMKEADIDQYEVMNTTIGEDLEGLSFKDPLGDKIPEKAEIDDNDVREVILKEEVPDDGTGFVFLVPEYKEGHQQIAEEKSLRTYNPILKNGYFDGGPRKNKYSGLSASASESVIKDDLEGKDLLFSRKKITKEVEVCDICRSRLIRYPIRGWYFETSQMIERAQEKLEQINVLHPTHNLGTKDWLLSRDNMWGVPLPRWECTCGSIFIPSDRAELADKSDYKMDENIKPDVIRNSTVNCPDCGEDMHWEKKTLDPLFIQSCSPWAQLNYPQQEEEYESWWPGQIFLGKKSDDIDLFTANLSLSLTLFGEPSVEEIMFLGSVSSEVEYKNVEHLVSKNGYDSLRMYLLSKEPLWTSRKITRADLEFPHKIPRVAWNLKRFFENNLSDIEIDLHKISSSTFEDELRPEDRWILSRVENAKNEISHNYKIGRFDLVIDSLEELILKDISQSYIKRARVRLDNESEEERLAVMRTVYLILKTISKLLTPVTPFTAENIYQSLNEGEKSVFIEDWPEREERYLDVTLETMMGQVRNIVDEIINIKRRSELPEKWPLRKIVYKARNERGMDLAEKFANFIRDKAIVKNIQIVGPDEEWEKTIFKAEPNREVISDSYKHWVRKIETLLRQKSSEKIKEGIEKGGFEIGLEGRIIEIDPDMVSFKREIPEDFEEITFDNQEIYVDLEVTEEIWEEETVKEVIFRLKSMRQDLDLSDEDEIEVYLNADRDVIKTIEKNRSEIEDEVRARKIRLEEVEMDEAQYILEWNINGVGVEIGIKPLYRTRIIDYYSSITGVDTNTAELLYESGYTTIDSLRDVNQSQLSNIEGIESDLAEDIITHIGESELENILEKTKEEIEESSIDESEGEEIEETSKSEKEEEVSKGLPEGISKSSTYLIEEKTSDRSFKYLKKILETGETGLCVTRDYPEKVKTKYDLEDIEMIWLSNVDREDVIRPKSLEKLSLALENFLAKTGGVILLKGLEYVITNNDFRTVLNLIQSIKDQVAVNESVLLIPVNPSIMEKYQIDQLSGVVDSTLEK